MQEPRYHVKIIQQESRSLVPSLHSQHVIKKQLFISHAEKKLGVETGNEARSEHVHETCLHIHSSHATRMWHFATPIRAHPNDTPVQVLQDGVQCALVVRRQAIQEWPQLTVHDIIACGPWVKIKIFSFSKFLQIDKYEALQLYGNKPKYSCQNSSIPTRNTRQILHHSRRPISYCRASLIGCILPLA